MPVAVPLSRFWFWPPAYDPQEEGASAAFSSASIVVSLQDRRPQTGRWEFMSRIADARKCHLSRCKLWWLTGRTGQIENTAGVLAWPKKLKDTIAQ